MLNHITALLGIARVSQASRLLVLVNLFKSMHVPMLDMLVDTNVQSFVIANASWGSSAYRSRATGLISNQGW